MPWKPLRRWRKIQDEQLIARRRIGRLEVSYKWWVVKARKWPLGVVPVTHFNLLKKRRYFE